MFREKTGLPVTTYFSGPKIRWLLDRIPGLRERAEAGEVLFGTIDSWLIWNLCGRHVTDVTNASRTLLMNLETLDWDPTSCSTRSACPRAMLPEIRASSEAYGEAGAADRRRPGRLGARRPARGARRADLLQRRRRQVHVRDRQLLRAEHRRSRR